MLVFVLHGTDLEVVGEVNEGLGAEPRRSSGAGSMWEVIIIIIFCPLVLHSQGLRN